MNKNFFVKIVVFTTIFSFLISIFTKKNDGYLMVPLIPLSYLLLFILCKNNNIYLFKKTGLTFLNLFMFVKYSLSIIFICLNKDFSSPFYTGITPSDESCTKAIILIIAEIISIFLAVEIFSNKFYEKKNIENNKESNNFILNIFLLTGAIAFFSKISYLLPSNIFITDYTLVNESIDIGPIGLIINSFKLIISGIYINLCVQKYKEKNKFIYILLSYTIIFVYILFNTNTSRTNMILPFIFFIIITKEVFGKKGRILLCISAITILISFFSITIYKNEYLFKDDISLSYFSKTLTIQIQEYTSNVRPLAQGIELKNKFVNQISIKTFFNDFIGSVPFLASSVDQTNRTNYYYNRYILGSDTKHTPLIIPIAAISSLYFSDLFSWIIIFFIILILMKIDSYDIFNVSNCFVEKYLFLYICYVLSYAIFCNTQIIVGRLINNFLLSFIIVYLNKKVRIIYK